MIIYSECFRNQSNERIELTIEQYGERSNHRKITLCRVERNFRSFASRIAYYYVSLQAMLIAIFFGQITQSVRVFSLFAIGLLLIVTLILYIYQEIKEESIILIDNFDGIEYETKSIFGRSTSTFINTGHVMINEGITMQRVIFYMVAIPRSLQTRILEQPQQQKQRQQQSTINEKDNEKEEQVSSPILSSKILSEQMRDVKLIPLFMRTLPRLDCLQVIYRFANMNQQEANSSLRA